MLKLLLFLNNVPFETIPQRQRRLLSKRHGAIACGRSPDGWARTFGLLLAVFEPAAAGMAVACAAIAYRSAP